jgi:predicted RNA-binding Zn ribbon-like protein
MTVIQIPPSLAGSLPLVGGSIALDFANTQSGLGTESHLNHLREPEHVTVWIEHAGGLSKEDAARLRDELSPAQSTALYARAIALRSAIYDVGAAIAAGSAPAEAALASLSSLHAGLLERADLAAAEDRCFWRWSVATAPIEAALGPIALAAVELFTHGDFSRIKQCGGHACGWLFFDATKNKGRRWCEMEVCGNRAKQRRLHARRRGA